MERLFEIGLSNALMSAALAVVAGLAGLVCRRPALVHALWLLVLIKLVTPPLASIRIRPPVCLDEPAAVVSLPEPSLSAPEIAMNLQAGEPEGEEDEGLATGEEEAPSSAPEAEPISEKVPAWRQEQGIHLLAGMWLVGSLAWFTLAARRMGRFSRALRSARPAPAALFERVSSLARQVGLRRCPRVLLVPGRITPMVWGAGSPVLLAPEGLLERVGEQGLDTLLLHELAHVRRRDHRVRWIEFLALGLFWWNPVAWYARRELREAEEQCCDAWVVRTLPAARRTYATALVDALDFLCDVKPALPPMSCGLGQVADVKRRLTMILRGTTPHGLGRTSALAVLGLALLLLPCVPLWGQPPAKTEEERKTLRFWLGEGPKKESTDDLQKVQAEIEKKAAELAALKAKMDAIKKQAAENADRGTVVIGRGRGAEGMPGQGPMIRIEISGLTMKPDELKKLADALEKSLPGKEKRILILAGGEKAPGAGHPWKIAPQGPQLRPGMHPPGGPVPPGAGVRPNINMKREDGHKPDQRIQAVEKKLDLLLRELEALRKDMRRPGPGGRGVPGGPGGPAPGFPGAAPKPGAVDKLIPK